MMLSGWGNYPRIWSPSVEPTDDAALHGILSQPATMITRGNGRSYGDAAIGTQRTAKSLRVARILAFDRTTGSVTAEAGVLLKDIISIFLPRGFFPIVVPGTRFVTLGGMVASNVHGKNHHLSGGFGHCVDRLKLILADGSVVECSPQHNAGLFRATIGGMGLTGIIVEVTFRLRPVETAYIRQQTVVANNLDEILKAFDEAEQTTYTVAWIDGLGKGASLGRSLLFKGEHALASELPADKQAKPLGFRLKPIRNVPFNLPSSSLNRASVTAFNKAYFAMGARGAGDAIVGWEPYFFPLDAVLNWNRVYGSAGFLQYQFVVPKHTGREALELILSRIANEGTPSFLAVLKLLGADEAGLLSFPLEGYTLAMDFPASSKTFALLDELDKDMVRFGGRIYLAKDSRQSRQTFDAGYPAADVFRRFRIESGAASKFSSVQSARLGL